MSRRWWSRYCASFARLVALSIGDPSDSTSSSLRDSPRCASRRAAHCKASPSTPSRNSSPRSSAAIGRRARRHGACASLKTIWHSSLSRPGCGGRPARTQSRWARPPFQAPVVNPSTSLTTPAISSARTHRSSNAASCSACSFIEPEQSTRTVSAQSATGCTRSLRNSRRSQGVATNCASLRPSSCPSSWPPSQPSRTGAASSARSDRASHARFTPIVATRASSRSRSACSSCFRTSPAAAVSRS